MKYTMLWAGGGADAPVDMKIPAEAPTTIAEHGGL